VLANDTDQLHFALSVTAVNGSSAAVGHSIAGTYGSLERIPFEFTRNLHAG